MGAAAMVTPCWPIGMRVLPEESKQSWVLRRVTVRCRMSGYSCRKSTDPRGLWQSALPGAQGCDVRAEQPQAGWVPTIPPQRPHFGVHHTRPRPSPQTPCSRRPSRNWLVCCSRTLLSPSYVQLGSLSSRRTPSWFTGAAMAVSLGLGLPKYTCAHCTHSTPGVVCGVRSWLLGPPWPVSTHAAPRGVSLESVGVPELLSHSPRVTRGRRKQTWLCFTSITQP